ncbi:MAG TPA: gluconate 2-dehydrogenase subunit 3 family protein, partial [Flavobacteriaceae bacterium]|nr:gluconate 2-dehydrogenase subunit 3 family protein [Flavobacteriaceae bacterium]
QFFNDEGFSLIKNLVDTILPRTDSPSATDVGVHQMIDTIVGKVYTKEQQQNFTKRFSSLKSYLGNSKNYTESLQELLNPSEENNKLAQEALLDLKQQTVLYYLNTKEISTTYLNYLPVPGKYKACISLEEVDGKAWAL